MTTCWAEPGSTFTAASQAPTPYRPGPGAAGRAGSGHPGRRSADPTGHPGPHVRRKRGALLPHRSTESRASYWIPEFQGDTICVNGKVWPFLQVEAQAIPLPDRQRLERPALRALPGSIKARGSWPADLGRSVTDGGYLDTPVGLDPNLKQKLVVLPGERADIIVDFAGLQGQTCSSVTRPGLRIPEARPSTGTPRGRSYSSASCRRLLRTPVTTRLRLRRSGPGHRRSSG